MGPTNDASQLQQYQSAINDYQSDVREAQSVARQAIELVEEYRSSIHQQNETITHLNNTILRTQREIENPSLLDIVYIVAKYTYNWFFFFFNLMRTSITWTARKIRNVVGYVGTFVGRIFMLVLNILPLRLHISTSS